MALGSNMKIDRLIPTEINVEKSTIEIPQSIEKTQEEPVLESVPESVVVEPKPEVNMETASAFVDIVNEDISIKFTPSRRKTQKKILITIEGNLTISNVELLHKQVDQVFASFDHVDITLTNVTEIDLTVIQLFHTIRVNYYSQNKFIYINAEFSKEDRKLLNLCGFTEFQTQKTAV
jgi:anti-anti-sigma regulatory factor